MPSAEIYSTQSCGSCVRAKYVLLRMGLDIEEIDVSMDRTGMVERTGRHTVPQIYVENTHIGGYEELMRAISSGAIDTLLGLEPEEAALEA